ncbi:MAG TPA: tetratricopeptide repeat protein [Thermoanaerobaculia bacterium]|jgi:predicted Zn-dependent protease
MGIAATDRGEYAAALPLLSAVYRNTPFEKFPQGLSYYGLCLAQVERKHKQGIQLCEQAMQLESTQGRHWANLVRLYIVGKNRRKAVQVLDSGLEKLGNDPALLRVRQEIGYRQAPSLGFLPRRNPLNKVFSRTAWTLRRLIRPRRPD